MPYGEVETKSMGREEELLSEPCSKKLKSTEEAYVFPYHGSGNFYRKQEVFSEGCKQKKPNYYQ